MGQSSFIVYVDESGDIGMDNFDPAYPIFALCAAVYQQDDYFNHDLQALSRLKFKHWWHDAVVFHSHKIRNKLAPFDILKEPAVARALVEDISHFFAASKATLIAAAIDKPRHKAQYAAPQHPYDLALKFVLERSCKHLAELLNADDEVMFVFEKRGKQEDKLLAAKFHEIAAGANFWGGRMPFRLSFAAKEENITGLQIADLAAYPIARYAETRNDERKDWQAIKARIRTGPNGVIDGWGLKIFP